MKRLLGLSASLLVGRTIVQLGPKLNTKLALDHHPPPGTFQRVLGIVRGTDMVCRLI